MEGLSDFEVPSRPLLDWGEQPRRTAIGRPNQWRKRSRRAAPPRLERKLAAIVAADVVGYSRLSGRDEEGAVRRLCETQVAISPIVEAAGGRIVNTAGDAMLLEFSSTVAALECALAIQDLVGLLNRGVPHEDKMLLRIGVNVGDVIVRGGDVFGEVVNVASRLEAIAQPGGICVSHACYAQTKRLFAVNFADLGEQKLKNIAVPVRAYAVRPPSASSLEQAAPSQAAPAAFLSDNVLPFARQNKFAADLAQAVGGGQTADEARLSDPPANSRHLPEASQASVAKNPDAASGSSPVESAPDREVETPNVLCWPGRRRT
jgi:class 3 adenylate cyclase